MSESEYIEEAFSGSEASLDDRSEELSERTEADAQIRFYRAMADTEADYGSLLAKLARTVAEVIYDLCVVYLIDDESGELESAAAYHPHPQTLQSIHHAFTPGGGGDGIGDGLVAQIISRQKSYFRPRWRPSLLKVYDTEESSDKSLEIAIHSLIVVPLVTTDGDCLGALLVGRHTTALSFDEADLALTEWIASHAAMKLETARLYRDLKQANHRLDAAVQARDTFIAIAAHELRTPLSTLKLHAQMTGHLARKKPEEFTPQKVLPKLDSMDRQVDYLDRLVDQLLNVSRIIDGGLSVSWERCDLGSVVFEVATRFSFDIDRAGSPLSVHCNDAVVGMWDQERLDHIVTNLLSNAIKYGSGNPIQIDVEVDNEQAILRVHDGGMGIADAARDKIFERFERAVDHKSTKGLGLGLWIVREYVESLEGVIEVESVVGEGSTFAVYLPLAPESSPG